MGICLNMIVKNESRNLDRLFESLQGWIDFYVIADTGSTDDTVQRIAALGRQWDIPGLVVSHPWVDFAHNRNGAMEAAARARQEGLHQCDWLLIIDADEELVVMDPGWKEKLVPGISYSTYKKMDGLAFKHYFLPYTGSNTGWQWKGSIHNYMEAVGGTAPRVHLNTVYILTHEFEGAKSHGFRDAGQKYRRDIILMQQELAGQEPALENIHRFFQLAYLYQVIKDTDASVRLFGQVSALAAAPLHMRYMADIIAARQLFNTGDKQSALQYFGHAYTLSPARMEYFYYRALAHIDAGEIPQAISLLEQALQHTDQGTDYWVMEYMIYAWKIRYELCLLYARTRRTMDALSLAGTLLEQGQLPAAEKNFILQLKQKLELR
jgi:glycosyltransferase involved in cell wall biosynthesis